MIIFKWTYFGASHKPTPVGEYPGSNCAPQLLIGLINMFMFANNPVGWNGNTTSSACSLVYFYPGQALIQKAFVVIAVVCVPWMLLAKPIGMNLANKRTRKQEEVRSTISLAAGRANEAFEELSDDSGHHSASKDPSPPQASNSKAGGGGGGGGGHGHGGGGQFSLGDVFIYQGIHTIEFTLGCISHTASYLRLWALSLAHSQLSEVLWTKIMIMGFTMMPGWAGAVFVWVFWWIFLALTIAILVMMEGLSAFLHALRLHWVEFNSKFFEGAGEPFLPFSFDKMLEEAKTGGD